MTSNQTSDAIPLAHLTADMPGVGGVIKRFDEDFLVDELPRYPTSGQGTHVFFTLEKRGLTTLAAIRLIARSLDKKPRDIGYAGMKDAHGITRQTLSVEHVDPARIQALELDRIKVESVTRHTNKIKLGHLAGNRFAIKIRDTVASPLQKAEPIIQRLAARGVPNYFGPQRFGARGDNARIGLAVLRDDYQEAIALILGRPGPFDQGAARRARELFDAGDLSGAERAWPSRLAQQKSTCRALIRFQGDLRKTWRAVDHTLRKLFFSAVQSDLFNRVLARRIDALDQLQAGDIAWMHRNGACFRVPDPAIEQPRCDVFEISPTGPLFGRRMTEPEGLPAELEAQVFAESGPGKEQMRTRDGTRLDGARRPLRVPLGEPTVDADKDDRGPYLRLTFTLPPGSYATCVTREVCKTG